MLDGGPPVEGLPRQIGDLGLCRNPTGIKVWDQTSALGSAGRYGRHGGDSVAARTPDVRRGRAGVRVAGADGAEHWGDSSCRGTCLLRTRRGT